MGNVFLGGNFEGTIDFDPGPGEDFHTHVGSYDAFLTKLTPDGDYVWTKTWGSPGIDWVMTQKREGQYLYNGGNFTGTIDFDPGPGVDWHTADDESDVFIIKMTVGGDFIWARTWDADAKLHYIGWGIQTDGLGHFYVCGWYQGKADFDPGPGVANCTSNGDRDIYLSKFDTDGNFIWVKAWGGPGYDQAHFLTIGPTGDIWVSSGFSNSLDIDPGPGVVNRTSKGDLDIGISIFDPDGNFLWDRSWGGAGRDWGNGFFFTENQELFMIGWFEQTVDWDPGPGVENHTAQGYKDPFLLKLLSNGYWE